MSAETHRAWNGPGVTGYPEYVIIGEKHLLQNGIRQREMIGFNLILERLVPRQGQILELGAASCTRLIFPLDHNRVIATDFSEVLLKNNPLPPERKFILDAGNERYPKQWTDTFSLVAGILLSRYLTQKEALFLAQQTYRCLKNEGFLLLVDIPQLSPEHPDLVQALAQQRQFDLENELMILGNTGYRNLSHGNLNLIFLDNEAGGDCIYNLCWVRGQKLSKQVYPQLY